MSFLNTNSINDMINQRNSNFNELRKNRRNNFIAKNKTQSQTNIINFINDIINSVKEILLNYISEDNDYCLYLLFDECPGNLYENDINYNPDDENDASYSSDNGYGLPCYERINYFINPNYCEQDLIDSILDGVYFDLSQCNYGDVLRVRFEQIFNKCQNVKLDILCYNLLKVLLRLDILLLSNELYDKELQNTIYLLGLLTLHCNVDEYNFVYDAVNIILDLLNQSSEYDSAEKMRVLIKELL